ncbi:Leucine rich repeat protein [Entamoeba marina]
MNNKQLDSYSILIVSKYLETSNDYVNVICVCKKFQETTEKLRYNPIPVPSTKLFPKMQTQYLYKRSDKKIKGVNRWEIWFIVNYAQYLKYEKMNIKCHHVRYTQSNRNKYGNEIPIIISMLGNNCFSNCITLTSINIPTTITSLGKYCYYFCIKLTSIDLQSSITSLGNYCFSHCRSLKSVTLPSTIKSLNDNCFSYCISLTSISIQTTLTSLGKYCFSNCSSLTLINLPTTLTSFGEGCFKMCPQLKSIINIPDKFFI